MTKTVDTFASAFGQQDNLGDVILRRHMLDVLRQESRLNLYVGTCSPSYVEALRLSPLDRTYDKTSRWLLELAKASLRRRTVFTFNTGEVSINRRFALSRLMVIPLKAAQLIRGGSVIHVGQGIKDKPKKRWRAVSILGLKLCSFVSWRDDRSRDLIGTGDTTPDWAFVEIHERGFNGQNTLRPYITVSLRGDRPYPDAEWLGTVKDYARSNGFRVAVATQVMRDSECSSRLAADLEGDLVDWTMDKPHARQEADLRSLYATSVAVISDRLHVLVVSMAEGATPIDASVEGNHKIRNTFAGAGLEISNFHRNLTNYRAAPNVITNSLKGSSLLAARIPAVRDSAAQLLRVIRREVSGTSADSSGPTVGGLN